VLALPLAGPRLVLRALNDLNTIADYARRQPDVVESIEARIDTLLVELAAVTTVVTELIAGSQSLGPSPRRRSKRFRRRDPRRHLGAVGVDINGDRRSASRRGSERTPTDRADHAGVSSVSRWNSESADQAEEACRLVVAQAHHDFDMQRRVSAKQPSAERVETD
jgi:hypothetical protein